LLCIGLTLCLVGIPLEFPMLGRHAVKNGSRRIDGLEANLAH
jgi:hypothetical protein